MAYGIDILFFLFQSTDLANIQVENDLFTTKIIPMPLEI